jgi:hypothetical protein
MNEYVVWLRNDGLVGCTVRMPNDWNTPSGSVTFIHLRTFKEWDYKCVDYITEQQSKSPYNGVH